MNVPMAHAIGEAVHGMAMNIRIHKAAGIAMVVGNMCLNLEDVPRRFRRSGKAFISRKGSATGKAVLWESI